MKCIVQLVLTTLIPVCVFSQQERWVYRYSGVANWRNDYANSVVFGVDSNIYAAGCSWHNATEEDLTVISLTNVGAERWVYNYCGPADKHDQAYAIVRGGDDNIYVAGSCYSTDTTRDFTVISLTSAGAERWVYQHNGPGSGPNYAYDVCYGNDSNVYVVGSSWGTSGNTDFTVASVTDSGTERWIYTYNGPGNYNDCARSVVYGSDGNIYAVGESYGGATNDDFTVISLTAAGIERWVYRYNGPGNWADYANSVGCDSDGNVYVTGSTTGFYGFDITIICLDTQGADQWIYRHSENYFDDCGYDGILGGDNNLYVAGIYGSDVPDFIVVSSTDSGGPRWEYIYYTPAFIFEAAMSIVFGDNSYVYAAGQVAPDSGFGTDFAIICLTDSGDEQWVYAYDRCGEADLANSILYGADGNIYAAGLTTDSITGGDFTVISLTGGPGIHENTQQSAMKHIIQVTPNPFVHYVDIFLSTVFPGTNMGLTIYDVTGHLVKQICPMRNYDSTSVVFRWDGTDNDGRSLPAGVYFVQVNQGDLRETKKVLLLK
jgi:hypothetical protein